MMFDNHLLDSILRRNTKAPRTTGESNRACALVQFQDVFAELGGPGLAGFGAVLKS
jgi:hypothetical protein